MTSTQDLSCIAKNGVLRAAINTGNRALVQQDGDTLTGVSPALAQRLAAHLGATLQPVMYSGAGKVFADALSDVWDVAFMAIDATRAQQVSFTRPYHVIEATFVTRDTSDIRDVAEVDRDGVQIVTSTGSAYDLYLRANAQAARLIACATPGDSFDAFKAGQGDVVAGVRASLVRNFGDDPHYRVLPGVLTQVAQAMVLPHPDAPGITALDDFVRDAIESGFVSHALT